MQSGEAIKDDEELGIRYVVIPELPREERDEFCRWLKINRINCPIIDNEGSNAMDCAFADDYYQFVQDYPYEGVRA